LPRTLRKLIKVVTSICRELVASIQGKEEKIAPMHRYANIRSDHVKIAEQSRHYMYMPSVAAAANAVNEHQHISGLCFLSSPTSLSQTQQNAFRRLHFSHS
jgi:proteasome lid subunit RPN8/RPN11